MLQLELHEDLLKRVCQQGPSLERAAREFKVLERCTRGAVCRSKSAEHDARELMVMDLYRRGALSHGKAAELLAMPLAAF